MNEKNITEGDQRKTGSWTTLFDGLEAFEPAFALERDQPDQPFRLAIDAHHSFSDLEKPAGAT